MTQSSIFPLINTQTLAALLDLAPETLEKRRAHYPQNLPPYYRILGRTVRYSKPEVLAWIDAGMPLRTIGTDSSSPPSRPDADARSPLWSTRRLAPVLGITVSSLEKRRSTEPDSLPPALKTGRSVRYREADVLAWLAQKRVTD